jgi:hypothetical protein
MTSGNSSARRRAAAMLLLCLPATALAADLGLEALLAKLARPAPASTPFVEVRWSQLLAKPLVTSGRLEYRGPDALARHVEQPYVEDTEIAGDEVRIARTGQRTQHFSLGRAPELRGLMAGFSALLGGDSEALERAFDAQVAFEHDGWSIELKPKDARTAKRIAAIDIHGRGNEPRCFAVNEAGGNGSILVLGAAAEAKLPDPLDRAALERRCADRD